MSEPLRAVLFDVDGTLVDTNYLHVVTWWQAFAQGGRYVPMADIHRAIGMGSDQMLDRLLPAGRDRDADSGLRISHDALYAAYWARLRPLPGAVELLRACKARGLAVVLASSAGEAESGALRAALDAEDAIDDATFAGEVERTGPPGRKSSGDQRQADASASSLGKRPDLTAACPGLDDAAPGGGRLSTRRTPG
jgi:beta-phosphoglucomutase-like phosphatase (HAD superfamily)